MTFRALTAEQMQKVDADTIAGGVPGLELMERAGRGITDVIQRTLACASGHAAVFVGSGNNGGDGLVVARHLMDAGWTCTLHLLKPGAECTPDTAANYQRLAGRSGLAEWDARNLRWPERAMEDVRGATVIIDSIFGTGFNGAPRDDAARMIELINDAAHRHDTPVFAIDIPSGVNGTNGAVRGVAVKADVTVTIGAAKTGLLFHPGRAHVGQVEVVDIGFPQDIVERHSDRVFYLGRPAAASKLVQRAADMHKYRAGVTVVVSGSDRYRGAPLLTGEAALRSGCGILYLAVPESLRTEIPASLEEAILIPLPQTHDGTIAAGSRGVLAPYVGKASAVAIGPGLGRSEETDAFVRDLVVSCAKPVVVDADALTAFAGHADEFRNATEPVIITPHDGELSRLTGEKIPTAPLERIAYARAAAARLGVTLVHKGAPALVAGPGGEVWINGSGSSALAKGGTGDVLTGFVASFLAQAIAAGRPAGEAVLDAACVACWLHGRAGEIEARERGERGVLASDLFASVGRAMVELESGS